MAVSMLGFQKSSGWGWKSCLWWQNLFSEQKEFLKTNRKGNWSWNSPASIIQPYLTCLTLFFLMCILISDLCPESLYTFHSCLKGPHSSNLSTSKLKTWWIFVPWFCCWCFFVLFCFLLSEARLLICSAFKHLPSSSLSFIINIIVYALMWMFMESYGLGEMKLHSSWSSYCRTH